MCAKGRKIAMAVMIHVTHVAVINFSPRLSSCTPGVFYTYFYSHAHRLRLEKLLYIELSRSFSGYFRPLSGSRWRFQK